MHPRHLVVTISIFLGALIGLTLSSAVPVATAAPSGYKIPFFGKSVITNGPGEGLHTGRSAEAIDYTPGGGWWSYVAATQAGTVVFSRNLADGFGRAIVIRHDNGTYSYYAHLSQRSVNEGDVVYRGQTIGVVGNTGCAPQGCGIHLHFESRTGVAEPVTENNLYNSGTAAWIRDIKGNGWFPWYPNAARNSGLVVYSPGYRSGECNGTGALIVIWPKPSEISGGSYVDGFSYQFSTSVATVPDTIVDGNREDGSASTNIGIGVKHYFHLRVKDTSGNWSASDYHTVHAGSYCRNR
jgi:hypothetical protein